MNGYIGRHLKWLTPEELREYQNWRSPNRKKNKKELRRKREQRDKERTDAEFRCRAYLRIFWENFNAALADEERLELLKKAANPPWPRVSSRLRQSLRAKYQRNQWKFLNFEILECGCCQSEKPAEKHHIVPLAFGGTNEDLNLLKIGLNCHNAIHPWLAEN